LKEKGKVRPTHTILLLCFNLIFLTSCVTRDQLEKLSLVTAVGYDIGEDDKMEGTTVIGQFDPSQKDVSEVTSSKAFTSKMIRQKMNLGTKNKMVSGQLRVAIFGKELAESGDLINIVDTLSRDPGIGTMVFLAISESTAKEILEVKPQQGNIGYYLYELIQQNIRGELLLSCTLHEFLQDYYDLGRDPSLPYLENKNNKIVANGMALVSGDRFAGRLNGNESFYVKLLREKFKAGSIELKLPIEKLPEAMFMDKPESNNLYINIDEIVSDSKIKVKDKTIPTFQIEINLDIRLQEITEDIMIDPKSIAALEKQINKEMSKEVDKVIKKLQDLKSDPVGFGGIYNAERGIKLKGEEWHDIFQKATFNIKIKSSILKTGVMD
jgi:spore germination protein